MAFKSQVPSVTVTYAQTGRDQRPNELGMRPMQERAYDKRGEQYLLIKSPPASGKSRAPMFIALDKLHNQGLRQAIVVVPERSIGSSFSDEPLSQHGFWADWVVKPNWDPDCGTGDSAAGGLVIFPSNRVRIMVATKPIDFRNDEGPWPRWGCASPRNMTGGRRW